MKANKVRTLQSRSEPLSVIREKERRLKGSLLISENQKTTSKVLAGLFIIACSYALTTTTLAVGIVYNIQDLYIVGGLFGLTSAVLTIIMCVKACGAICAGTGTRADRRELEEIEVQINRDFGSKYWCSECEFLYCLLINSRRILKFWDRLIAGKHPFRVHLLTKSLLLLLCLLTINTNVVHKIQFLSCWYMMFWISQCVDCILYIFISLSKIGKFCHMYVLDINLWFE